jgi:hypothetical protein
LRTRTTAASTTATIDADYPADITRAVSVAVIALSRG